VILDYIDFELATKKVLRSYEDMVWQQAQCQKQVQNIEQRMTAPKSPILSSTPVSGGGSSTEDMWIKSIDKKAILESDLGDAKIYMGWFLPAWSRLTEEEQILLKERFMRKNNRGQWVETVRGRLFIAKSEAYDRSNEALRHLTFLLWGRN